MDGRSSAAGPGAFAILTKAAAGTGNFVTACRLSECIKSCGQLDCLIVEESLFETQADFSRWLVESNVVFVLGVHAFRAGRLLCDAAVPFGLVLGGTDVNVDLQGPPAKRDVCIAAIVKARFVVAFSDEMASRLKTALSQCVSCSSLVQSVLRNVTVIHQSVCIPHEVVRDRAALPSIHQHIGLDQGAHVILLPAALRPIKEPLFLLQALQQHNQSCDTQHSLPRFCLVIVGPSLDHDTLRSVQDACAVYPQSCVYLGLQPRRMVLHWMLSSFCVANTSESEGMSGTILEAMAIGCPVVARHNAGNRNLVKHGINGFIFSSACEAVRLCVELAIGGAHLRALICDAAAETVANGHSPESELLAFNRLFREHSCLQLNPKH
jgi:glycosyltransferase involved in cell wall biosynthesis